MFRNLGLHPAMLGVDRDLQLLMVLNFCICLIGRVHVYVNIVYQSIRGRCSLQHRQSTRCALQLGQSSESSALAPGSGCTQASPSRVSPRAGT